MIENGQLRTGPEFHTARMKEGGEDFVVGNVDEIPSPGADRRRESKAPRLGPAGHFPPLSVPRETAGLTERRQQRGDGPLVPRGAVSRGDLDEESVDPIHAFDDHPRQERREGGHRRPADAYSGKARALLAGHPVCCFQKEVPIVGHVDVGHAMLDAGLEQRQRQVLIGAGGADGDLDSRQDGLDRSRLREIADTGSQAWRKPGAESAEELLHPAAPACAHPNIGFGVAEEILDEEGTEVPACAHDQDARRPLAQHGAIIPFGRRAKMRGVGRTE